MTSQCLPYDEYELSRTSTHTSDTYEPSSPLEDEQDEHQLHLLSDRLLSDGSKSLFSTRFPSLTPTWLRKKYRPRRSRTRVRRISRICSCSLRSFYRKLALILYAFIATILTVVVVGGIFFPGYTHPPPHYETLRKLAADSDAPGRANIHHEKVYIAASIFDKGGKLANGPWAENVLALIDLLGPENTFLSIYVNDAGPEAKEALEILEKRVPCEHALVFEEHLGLDQVPHVTLPDGSDRVKRIDYLAEVRNRALRPLDTLETRFDKLLYMNDVVFHPVEAANLLFSTHATSSGRAEYRAACAVDFINPFKFYDTFATRDMEGFRMGIPFYPWFSAGGSEQTHQDVLDGIDSVRVRSCWGGMVAFDAQFFQKPPEGRYEKITAGNQSPSNLTAPYHFRAEQDLFWDASECCLIQADIQNPETGNSEIYMNPFIRVAYDTRTLSWLGFTRRFERLYTPVHFLLDIMVSAPRYNPRRDEEPWQRVEETVWVRDDNFELGGSFQRVTRIASHAGFCGMRKLSVIKENITEGERNWETLPVPPL